MSAFWTPTSRGRKRQTSQHLSFLAASAASIEAMALGTSREVATKIGTAARNALLQPNSIPLKEIDFDLAKNEPKRKHEDGEGPIPSLEKLMAMADVRLARSAAEEKEEEGNSAKKIKA